MHLLPVGSFLASSGCLGMPLTVRASLPCIHAGRTDVCRTAYLSSQGSCPSPSGSAPPGRACHRCTRTSSGPLQRTVRCAGWPHPWSFLSPARHDRVIPVIRQQAALGMQNCCLKSNGGAAHCYKLLLPRNRDPVRCSVLSDLTGRCPKGSYCSLGVLLGSPGLHTPGVSAATP